MLWNVIFSGHDDDGVLLYRQVCAPTRLEAKELFRNNRGHESDYIISITEVEFDLM